jgi:hypothetical protein
MNDFHKISPEDLPILCPGRLPCPLKVLSKIPIIAEFYNNMICIAIAEACEVCYNILVVMLLTYPLEGLKFLAVMAKCNVRI